MDVIITGKQVDVNPRLQQVIERKVRKLSRLAGDAARVEVVISEEKTRSAQDRFSVQIVLYGNAHAARSEMSAVNANTALDLALDKIVAQLGRQKDRQTAGKRHRTSAIKVLTLSRSGELSPVEGGYEQEEKSQKRESQPVAVQSSPQIAGERVEEIWSKILEIRRLPAHPMDDREVIMQMEALGLSFFPFYNEETHSVNVMYRLDGGGYGLLVPEAGV